MVKNVYMTIHSVSTLNLPYLICLGAQEWVDGGGWFWIRLDTGAPSGYLDPYLQVFSDKNPYLDLQGSFSTVHLDPQVFYLQVTGQQVLKVPAGIPAPLVIMYCI